MDDIRREVQGKRVLVTGASGFLGSRTTQRLIAEGATVYPLFHACQHENSQYVGGIFQDIAKPLSVEAFPLRIDSIIHLAAETSSKVGLAALINTNIIGTLRLLRYGKKAGASNFVYASTGGIYGYHSMPITEKVAPRPLNLYGLSKYLAEKVTGRFNYDFTAVTLRFFFPYGSGQVSRLVPRLIEQIRAGKMVTTYNGGLNPVLNPIYVDDAVEAILRASLQMKGRTINVAGPDSVSIKEIAMIISRLLERVPLFNDTRNHAITNMVADIGVLKSILSFVPAVRIHEGLARTLGRGLA